MAASKQFRDSIHAKGTEIAVLSSGDDNDYISLTDIAKYKSDAPDDVIKNWILTSPAECVLAFQNECFFYDQSTGP